MAQQEHDTAEGRLRVRGRVRHVEMDAEIQDVGSEIPVLVDGGDSHVSHYWQIHLSSCFPLGRRHCTQLSQEAYCILSGDLCRERGALPHKRELAFYLQKISAKTGLALPSGELADNRESIKF